MTNNRTRTLSLLLVCLLSLAAYAQAPARYEMVRFESKLVSKTLPYNVVLPADYSRRESQTTRYPVLYLLHGLTGHYTDWLTRTKLADYAAEHRLIVVTPEGNDGWYTDSATAQSDKYESYIVRELLPDVERRFRTIEARGGRAVAGLSMGGYGALKFGVKYPELFALAASMSGAVAAASWRGADELPQGFIRTSLVQTFGPAGGQTKAANDLFKLLREMTDERARRLPFLYLDCGTEDSLRLLPSNRALADLLYERKIPHEYRQLPGDHNWAYWDRQVQEVLRLAVSRLAAPAQARAARARATAPPLDAARAALAAGPTSAEPHENFCRGRAEGTRNDELKERQSSVVSCPLFVLNRPSLHRQHSSRRSSNNGQLTTDNGLLFRSAFPPPCPYSLFLD